MVSKKIREQVAERAERVCEYCHAQEKFSPDTFTIDHIIPLSSQGDDTLENLAFACQGCNSFKYTYTEAIDPGSGKIVTLFNPRVNIWAEHFKWAKGNTIIVGLTSIGRATVERLKLNREGLVNLREVLGKTGKHLPE